MQRWSNLPHWRALICGALVATLVTVLMIPLLHHFFDRQADRHLQLQIEQAGRLFDLELARIDGALQRLSSWSDCGADQFRERRRELTLTPNVVDFFFLDAEHHRLCASPHEPEEFLQRELPAHGGLGHIAATASLLTGESVFHLYRHLPTGEYVVARLPGQWLTMRASELALPLNGGYYGIIDNQTGEPLTLFNWHPRLGLPHLAQTLTLDRDYQAGLIEQQWVQVQPLLAAPGLSLIQVIDAAQLHAFDWAITAGLCGGFVVVWALVALGLFLWWRPESDPYRLLACALAQDEFFNVYQPIRDGRSGRLCGFEVLLRWRSASGIIGPQHFIPMADKTGLLVEMTRRQIEEAIDALQPLLALAPDLKVSFNITTAHLDDEAFIAQSLLWHAKIPHLVYEITEDNMVATHNAAQLSVLQRLQQSGIRLAVDDFGTGYSSLAYLQSLPLDILKADRCFVAALGSDSVNATILEAIIRLAHRLQLDVIAEGVTEESQIAWLNQHGVVLQQGWRHGYPLPIYEGRMLWQHELAARRQNLAVA